MNCTCFNKIKLKAHFSLSNPQVQIVAVDAGALQQLVRMLPTETHTNVRKRVMYAIASIVRNFPFAQEQ